MLTSTHTANNRLPLLIGDVITFLAFAALGRQAHSMGSALDDIAYTALPFLVAWLLIAPFTGAFTPEATSTPKAAAKRAVGTWLFAFPLGYGIRILMRGGVIPHISFGIVAGIFTLVMLTGWRTLFAKVSR